MDGTGQGRLARGRRVFCRTDEGNADEGKGEDQRLAKFGIGGGGRSNADATSWPSASVRVRADSGIAAAEMSSGDTAVWVMVKSRADPVAAACASPAVSDARPET